MLITNKKRMKPFFSIAERKLLSTTLILHETAKKNVTYKDHINMYLRQMKKALVKHVEAEQAHS